MAKHESSVLLRPRWLQPSLGSGLCLSDPFRAEKYLVGAFHMLMESSPAWHLERGARRAVCKQFASSLQLPALFTPVSYRGHICSGLVVLLLGKVPSARCPAVQVRQHEAQRHRQREDDR